MRMAPSEQSILRETQDRRLFLTLGRSAVSQDVFKVPRPRLVRDDCLADKWPDNLRKTRQQKGECIAPGSLDTSLSHAAGLSDIAVCHA